MRMTMPKIPEPVSLIFNRLSQRMKKIKQENEGKNHKTECHYQLKRGDGNVEDIRHPVPNRLVCVDAENGLGSGIKEDDSLTIIEGYESRGDALDNPLLEI